ncbi:hydroxysteroid dehydrogenase-like protein 2 isoform X2 [Eriocheir sinensis]|uniref:hydroxysteroid dehydrogenase-like protein 2 isoform X2 n=1 Tax=Eriocheir sinensis TaxID=95602 RepID=UPI0021CA68F9|nr:hydroxysteroid dehydrogenase-like protein 2 isoform X2 [Eriocheir sinensis]
MQKKLAGRTLFITGASRGIGKAIALRAAGDGANIVVAAKTADPHPKLPGTIYTAAKEIEAAGGQALPCVVDVRDEGSVKSAVDNAVKQFGGIDILVNNASAISLTRTLDTPMKKYDLMHQINLRGTYLVSKLCVPHLLKSPNAHILNISPPLNMNPRWFKDHVAYTMAKYGMSMCILGMAEEYRDDGIACNALWPRTAIITAAMEMLGGDEVDKQCRKPEIMADAAYAIITKDSRSYTGHFAVDDEVLKAEGITNFDQYAVDPNYPLLPDFFLDEFDAAAVEQAQQLGAKPKFFEGKTMESDKPKAAGGQVAQVFTQIEGFLSADLVDKTKAVYAFEVTGDEAGKWFIDLKNGTGACGKGECPVTPDATFIMNGNNFFKMFSGSLKPATAFMTGKMKISGDMGKALKLEQLMGKLKSKL